MKYSGTHLNESESALLSRTMLFRWNNCPTYLISGPIRAKAVKVREQIEFVWACVVRICIVNLIVHLWSTTMFIKSSSKAIFNL